MTHVNSVARGVAASEVNPYQRLPILRGKVRMLLSGVVSSQNELGTHAGHRQSEAAEFAGRMVLAAGGRLCGVSAAGVVIPTQSRGALQRARYGLSSTARSC